MKSGGGGSSSLLSLLTPSALGGKGGADSGPSPTPGLDSELDSSDESLMAGDILAAIKGHSPDNLADALRAFINMG